MQGDSTVSKRNTTAVTTEVETRISECKAEVFKSYLSGVSEFYTIKKDEEMLSIAPQETVAYFDITRLVLDDKARMTEKLKNIYHLLAYSGNSLALVVHRDHNSCQIGLAVGKANDSEEAARLTEGIQDALLGNFPGSSCGKVRSFTDTESSVFRGLNERAFFNPNDKFNYNSVAVVSNIASEFSEGYIDQRIEKLLDGIVPPENNEYTIVILGESLSSRTLEEIKHDLAVTYTNLSPFSKTTHNWGSSQANSWSKNWSAGVNVFAGVQNVAGGGVGVQTGKNDTYTTGNSQGVQVEINQYEVTHTLEIIERQMNRLERCEALGIWRVAAYVFSTNCQLANEVAHVYMSLTQGNESFYEKPAINVWNSQKNETVANEARELSQYVKRLRHPVLLKTKTDYIENEKEVDYWPNEVTPTAVVSGAELALALNLPQKSVTGFSVIECAEFGRNVVSYDMSPQDNKMVELGNIFHMEHEEHTPVSLSLESLKSHAFITGSTGSGKSNTVYHLLNEAQKLGIQFLIIEPAKGEYKHVFGNQKGVQVYSTNPAIAPLLRINPFSFPKETHILEHLDRLVELFNVCWPMYAAMPAVLKSGIEKAYECCGWDLLTSKNRFEYEVYPDFAAVADCIREIIDSSEYDAENKGAYKGSLLTRLQSLSNGINGMIFSSEEIPDAELFEKNVIIDLSRVGSSETKSLIMGMLVLKLQEYRMSSNIPMNSELRHLTVLEEAHNLLRRTSIEQSSESSNILGKSVEMLANAIAEMRTYGEGFIIVDQAPGLMDMSVVRNTNTKIIMRLPDKTDRELVGRAANLNDDQINELAKLPRGVAAIYQNEWVQPVLCKIKKSELGDGGSYDYEPYDWNRYIEKDKDVRNTLLKSIMDKELFQVGEKQDLKELKYMVVRSRLSSCVKVEFLEYLDADDNALGELRTLLYDFLNTKEAIDAAANANEIRSWVRTVIDKLNPSIEQYSKKQVELALALLLEEQVIRDSTYRDIYLAYTEMYREGGII